MVVAMFLCCERVSCLICNAFHIECYFNGRNLHCVTNLMRHGSKSIDFLWIAKVAALKHFELFIVLLSSSFFFVLYVYFCDAHIYLIHVCTLMYLCLIRKAFKTCILLCKRCMNNVLFILIKCINALHDQATCKILILCQYLMIKW